MKKEDIKKILSPGELLAGIIVLTGLILALLIDDITVKFVGLAVSVLGLIGFFWLMSNKQYAENGKEKPAILRKLDSWAEKLSKPAKQGDDGFIASFGRDVEKSEKKHSNVKYYDKNPLDDLPDEYSESDIDGFRIVPKGESAPDSESAPKNIPKPVAKPEFKKPEKKIGRASCRERV